MRAVLALLLLIVAIAGFSGDAWAHAGMAGHGSAVAGVAVADAAAPVTEAAAVPAGTDRSPGHRPAGKCCTMVAGCGNAGSILAGVPLLPVPEGAAGVDPVAIPDAPRSLDPPVADRPPRPA